MKTRMETAMEEMKTNEVVTEETVEKTVAEVKKYVVNCKNCGAALKVADGSKAYMCPVCNKLFALRKTEKLVKEISEEEKRIFFGVATPEEDSAEDIEIMLGDETVEWSEESEKTWVEAEEDETDQEEWMLEEDAEEETEEKTDEAEEIRWADDDIVEDTEEEIVAEAEAIEEAVEEIKKPKKENVFKKMGGIFKKKK